MGAHVGCKRRRVNLSVGRESINHALARRQHGAWLVISTGNKIADDEAVLMRYLVPLAREHHQVVDEQLANLVEVDPTDVWARKEAERGDLTDVVDAATRVAGIDGQANSGEGAVIDELRKRAVYEVSA